MKRNLLLAAIFAALAVTAPIARADVPRTIAFQGTLKDAAGKPITSSRSVTFTLYDAATVGNSVWTETKAIIPDATGLFATSLGSVTPLTSVTFDKSYWVGVKMGTDSEMVPRLPLQSVPYALALPNVVVAANGNMGVGVPFPTAKLSLPFQGMGGNTLLCGDPADLGGNDFELAVAIPANGTHWPFGVTKAGTPVFTVDAQGNAYLNGLSPTGDIQVNNGRRIGTNLYDAFTYRNNAVGHYSLGWYPDNELTDGGVAYLSGWAGIRLFTGGGPRVTITNGGMSINGSASANTLTLTSSRRFKEDIAPIKDALGTIQRLQGVKYQWDPAHGGKRDLGFVAEDVQKVVPELVTMEPDGKAAIGMDYSHLTALTVEAIKQQQVEIRALKAQNAALAARLRHLESRKGGKG